MSIDLRAFRYALQPVLNRQKWRVDAAQACVATALRTVLDQRAAIARHEEQLAAVAASLSGSGETAIDPAQWRRGLQWLAAERARIAWMRGELARLEADHAALQAEWRSLEARLEGMNEHRRDAQGEFERTQQRREAAAADNDWLARSGAAGGPSP